MDDVALRYLLLGLGLGLLAQPPRSPRKRLGVRAGAGVLTAGEVDR